MAGRFSEADWTQIITELEQDPSRFGLPEGGREKSLVLASFNIRKLGSAGDRGREIDFLARFCACCDLVAIQEVQDDLEGLRLLKERTEARVAGEGEYALAVSDITGQVPGKRGMAERLAFLYRHRRIRRLDMASDLTFDRTAVINRFFEQEEKWIEARREYERKVEDFEAGRRRSAPTFAPPDFLTFVRTPYVVAFEAPAALDQPALSFTAVNAHLVFGTMGERQREFEALLEWLIHRMTAGERLVTPSFVLLGDLNLNFDNPENDRPKIDARIRRTNEEAFGDPNVRRVYFPFLDEHPVLGRQLRSNARGTETYDQIAFFRGEAEQRLPNDLWRAGIAAGGPDGYEYGVFDFAGLFARTLLDRDYRDLTTDEKKDFGKSFEHSVSDHLPIWVRIPRPGFAPPPDL